MDSPTVNRIGGRVVPPLLLSYFGFALYHCNADVIPWLQSRCSSWYTASYRIVANAGIPFLVLTYLHLFQLPTDHSAPPSRPPEEISGRRIVFPCPKPADAAEDDGGPWAVAGDVDVPLNRCWRDACAGRWKPPRTRHCGTCRRCKVGFDHHCPWFNNCLTAAHIRSFLHLAIVTPLVVSYLVTPVLPVFWAQARLVLASSAQLPFFGGWTSWIVFGGPVGRWTMMLAVGYWRSARSGRAWEGMIVGPSGTLAVLVLLGAGFALICMGLAYGTITHALRGEFQVDWQRRKAYNVLVAQKAAHGNDPPAQLLAAMHRLDPHEGGYFSVPNQFSTPQDDLDADMENVRPSKGVIVKRPAHTSSPYDQGTRRRNWQLIMGRGLQALVPQFWAGPRPIPMPWPINEEVLRHLEQSAEAFIATEERATLL